MSTLLFPAIFIFIFIEFELPRSQIKQHPRFFSTPVINKLHFSIKGYFMRVLYTHHFTMVNPSYICFFQDVDQMLAFSSFSTKKSKT